MLRLCSLALLLAAGASAQTLSHGAMIPLASESFAAADGSQTSLDAATGSAGLVVVFWSNTCPWTDRYAPRLADLVARYTPAGVGFVLVNSNDPTENEREAATASRETSASSGLAVPYLADPSGRLAASFGATSAPHAFFFDGSGSLRYDGAIDDSATSPARVRVPYLAQAMDQSVAGIPIEVQRTQAFGCTIKQGAE